MWTKCDRLTWHFAVSVKTRIEAKYSTLIFLLTCYYHNKGHRASRLRRYKNSQPSCTCSARLTCSFDRNYTNIRQETAAASSSSTAATSPHSSSVVVNGNSVLIVALHRIFLTWLVILSRTRGTEYVFFCIFLSFFFFDKRQSYFLASRLLQ